jgi:hypothetical protein
MSRFFLKGITRMRRQSVRLAVTLLAFVIGFAALFYPVFRANALSIKGYPEPMKIIQQEGRFIFTDGSSYYLFKKDGTFKSGPLGLSGREIEGTWKLKDTLFVIEGRWGWINGGSSKDDYRRLTLYISTPEGIETIRYPAAIGSGVDVKVYKTYVEIEDLQKIPKPEAVK